MAKRIISDGKVMYLLSFQFVLIWFVNVYLLLLPVCMTTAKYCMPKLFAVLALVNSSMSVTVSIILIKVISKKLKYWVATIGSLAISNCAAVIFFLLQIIFYASIIH